MIENVLGPPLRPLSLYTGMPTIFLQTPCSLSPVACPKSAQVLLVLAVTTIGQKKHTSYLLLKNAAGRKRPAILLSPSVPAHPEHYFELSFMICV